MEPKEIIVKLARPARKKGGDRYEAPVSEEQFTIYIPQWISRNEDNVPASSMKVTFEPSWGVHVK